MLERAGDHMRQLIRAARRGMTLIELSIGIALLAVLLSLAGPFMTDILRNAKLREAGNTLITTLQFARNEAIKRNEPLTVRIDAHEVVVLDGSDQPLRAGPLPEAVTAALVDTDGEPLAPPLVRYGGSGRTVPFGTAGHVDLTLAGVACGENLRCPRVMVRAGGSVRLCKTQVNC
jgi:type IV fimbrial biogenesis protein FimT